MNFLKQYTALRDRMWSSSPVGYDEGSGGKRLVMLFIEAIQAHSRYLFYYIKEGTLLCCVKSIFHFFHLEGVVRAMVSLSIFIYFFTANKALFFYTEF